MIEPSDWPRHKSGRCGFVLALGLLCCTPVFAQQSPEERSLAELRNTVVNLLQALVEKGVLTREQAQAMIKDAQTKAQAEVAQAEAQAKAQQEAEKGAVRVPYVPEIVRDQISKQVASEIGPSVKQQVEQDLTRNDGLRSVLPDWVQRMTWTGDVRVREERDNFASDNATNTYLDYNQVNSKGGIDRAGTLAFMNTTEDRDRLRLRLRFGFDTDLGSGWSAGMRLATGSGEIFPTTNQSLGTYGDKYQIAVDQGYISWTGQTSSGRQILTATGGRFANPFFSTDLVWYNDLTFEGIVSKYRLNLSSDNAHREELYLTLGGFPLGPYAVFDPNPYGKDKWLLGAQLGLDLNPSDATRLRFGAAYYDYAHNVGVQNTLNSTLQNWTAPALFQHGNTVFDISNMPNDPTVNLFALASDFRIIDLTAVGDWHVTSRYLVSLTGQAVRNIGFKAADVMARTGVYVAPRRDGYRADLALGSAVTDRFGAWRAAIGYRYLQRDAVVDAFNDEDFHLGGTDARGYTLTFDFAINPRVWLRAKYLSANEIDGPSLGIDVWQFDVNSKF